MVIAVNLMELQKHQVRNLMATRLTLIGANISIQHKHHATKYHKTGKKHLVLK